MRASDHIEGRLETLFGKKQWQEIAGILQKQAPQWMDAGQGTQLDKWLKRLPDDFIAQSPWPLFWCGIVRLSSSPHESSCTLFTASQKRLLCQA